MAKLIYESVFDRILCESSNDGKDLYITGPYSTAEVENANKRKYKKSTLEKGRLSLEESITNRTAYGELNHPLRPSIDPSEVCILIESLEWDGDDLMGRSVVLDTPKGQIVKAIMKKGNLGISSRATGSVGQNGVVNENDFNLCTFDLVLNASSPNSKIVNGIYESVDFITPGEIEEQKAKDLSEAKRIEEEKLNEAKIAYKKHIWSVIDKITKKL